MVALMEMTNPMWEWVIAPIALMSIGFFVGHFVGRWEKDDEVLDRWDWEDSAPPVLRPLSSQNRRPYDWEQETDQ